MEFDSVLKTFADVPLPDLFALGFFILCWLFYAPFLKRLGRRGGFINSDMTVIRRGWMANMAARDNRFIDSQLLGHAINSASFFASSNLIVIAAAAGVLFGGDAAYRSMERLAGVAPIPHWMFQIKLGLVVVVLARGFLDFIWALRQMNYCLAVIGAAPPPDLAVRLREAYAEGAAQILNPALSAFNTGVRGYYFALAAAAWLAGPAPLAAVALGAVLLLVLRQGGSASAGGVRAIRTVLDQIGPVRLQEPGGAPEMGGDDPR
jgi:uncharacterized membrane protein